MLVLGSHAVIQKENQRVLGMATDHYIVSRLFSRLVVDILLYCLKLKNLEWLTAQSSIKRDTRLYFCEGNGVISCVECGS